MALGLPIDSDSDKGHGRAAAKKVCTDLCKSYVRTHLIACCEHLGGSPSNLYAA